MQPRTGPDCRTTPQAPRAPRSCTPSSLGCGDPTVTRLSLHVSSFCKQEEPFHVSSHFISKDLFDLVRMHRDTCPNDWGYFAEATVKNSKLHSLYQNRRLQCATNTIILHCCTAEQTFSHVPPEVLPQHTLRPIRLSSDGTLRNAHPDPPDSVLHPGFVWEWVCLGKWHSLLSRSCSNREGTLSHPQSPQDLSAKRPEEMITQTEKTFTLQRYLHHTFLDQRLLEVNTRPWHYQ